MIQLQGSVGRGGLNRYADVATVQTLVNDCIHLLTPLRPLETDGVAGTVTIAAIEEFQRRVLRSPRPDGRVDRGGRTLRALVTSARPAAPAAPRIAPGAKAMRFPMAARPTQSYKDGMRRFGANRAKGRLHAGCDLYAPVGTPIYALDEGEVIKSVYFFYLGTYALEVQHPGFVARYGEITRDVPAGVKKGARVERGQQLGSVGLLEGINMSMLHLELYSGSVSGPLTVRGSKPYQRRSDLIDPASILDAAVLV